MRLNLNVDGIFFGLEIKDYSRENRAEYGCTWCRTNFSVAADHWLNYEIKNAEILTDEEIDELTNRLEELLNGALRESEKVRFIEPDFVLQLYSDQNNPILEWRTYFWEKEKGLTANYLSLCFNRTEIEALWAYLKVVQGEFSEKNTLVQKLIQKKILE